MRVNFLTFKINQWLSYALIGIFLLFSLAGGLVAGSYLIKKETHQPTVEVKGTTATPSATLTASPSATPTPSAKGSVNTYYQILTTPTFSQTTPLPTTSTEEIGKISAMYEITSKMYAAAYNYSFAYDQWLYYTDQKNKELDKCTLEPILGDYQFCIQLAETSNKEFINGWAQGWGESKEDYDNLENQAIGIISNCSLKCSQILTDHRAELKANNIREP